MRTAAQAKTDATDASKATGVGRARETMILLLDLHRAITAKRAEAVGP